MRRMGGPPVGGLWFLGWFRSSISIRHKKKLSRRGTRCRWPRWSPVVRAAAGPGVPAHRTALRGARVRPLHSSRARHRRLEKLWAPRGNKDPLPERAALTAPTTRCTGSKTLERAPRLDFPRILSKRPRRLARCLGIAWDAVRFLNWEWAEGRSTPD